MNQPEHARWGIRFRSLIGSAALAIIVLLTHTTSAAPATQPVQTKIPGVNRLTDIRYGEAAGNANLLDVYLPEKIDHPRPLIVWVHGGGWAGGDKNFCPAVAAVSQGFVVASINYRLTSEAIYPAQIQDCKGAIRFLRAHADQYGIDPKRIGVWGASAGGHLVALLGTSGGSKELEGTVGGNLNESSRVQAVCDFFGPTDLSKFADEAQAAGIIGTTPGPRLIMALFGGGLQQKKDLVQLANPIAFISETKAADLPPFLIMHGDKDKVVPVAQSQLLDDSLTAAGARVEFKIVPGAGHGTGFSTPAIARTVLEFFQKNL
jgi:acetyl esterase/lipase